MHISSLSWWREENNSVIIEPHRLNQLPKDAIETNWRKGKLSPHWVGTKTCILRAFSVYSKPRATRPRLRWSTSKSSRNQPDFWKAATKVLRVSRHDKSQAWGVQITKRIIQPSWVHQWSGWNIKSTEYDSLEHYWRN